MNTNQESGNDPQPYLERVRIEKVWNPGYPQDAECRCSHPYYRHFDTYEDMLPVGCKYCSCFEFDPDIRQHDSDCYIWAPHWLSPYCTCGLEGEYDDEIFYQ